MKYIVYCTINLVNNKIYIGVHKEENIDKFSGYIGCGVKTTMPSTYMNPKTVFQYAVKKYGVKNFKRTILYIYDTPEEAYLKEKEIVNEDFIKLNTNYNMVLGGGINRPTEPIYQFNDEGNLVKKWEELTQASEFFNCPEKSFKNACLYKEKLFGYFWSRKSSINRTEYSKGSPKKPVYKYSKDGKLVEMFNSITECAKEENKLSSSLISSIQGESLVDKKYYYSFSLTDEFKPKPKVSLRGKKFYLYSLEGDYLQELKNCKELQKFMGVRSYSSVYDVIFKRNGIYKDYQIKLEKFDKIPKAEKRCAKKKVDVFDKTGNLLGTYNSVMEAAKKYNAKTSSVNRVLRGLANTTAGYIFKFHINQ